jgi:predicted kinase
VDLAYEYALQFSRPTIYVVCGMIASGKSTVAGALAEALQIKTINSDVVRKKLFSQQSFESRNADFEEGMYRKGATAVTYDKLLKESQEQIRNGHSVILDATFSREYQRRDVLRMAADTDTNIVFIECRCREAVIRQRLEKRNDDHDVSDARLKRLDGFKRRYETFNDIGSAIVIAIDTEKPLEENMAVLLARLA